MYLLILPAVSKNIIDKGRKSICVTVSLRTYMYCQLIYLHFGGSYTQGRIGPAAPPPLGRWAPGTTMHFFMNLYVVKHTCI